MILQELIKCDYFTCTLIIVDLYKNREIFGVFFCIRCVSVFGGITEYIISVLFRFICFCQ